MYIFAIIAAFAFTTLYYVLLYHRLGVRGTEIPEFREEPLDEKILKDLKEALARDKRSLEELLIELKEIRKQAEELLDDK